MSDGRVSFARLAITMIVVHTITYVTVGALAFSLLGYAEFFATPDMARLMRPTTDPLIMAGPLFQPLRGFVFGLAVYPLRAIVFGRPRGWLVLWGLFVAVGIVSTFGPAPGSIEGLIYTTIAMPHHLRGLPEVLVQSALLAFGVTYLVEHPEKRWLHRLVMTAFALAVLLPLAGLLAGSRGT
jgi:hypothetical protein